MLTIYVPERATRYDANQFIDFLERVGETPLTMEFVLSLNDLGFSEFYSVIWTNNERYTINVERVGDKEMEIRTLQHLYELINEL